MMTKFLIQCIELVDVHILYSAAGLIQLLYYYQNEIKMLLEPTR